MTPAELLLVEEETTLANGLDSYEPWEDIWVPYPAAISAIKTFDWLFNKPFTVRPINVVVSGPSNSGKTMLLRHYQQLANRKQACSTRSSTPTQVPVIYIQTPPEGDRNALLSLLLLELSAPTPSNANPSRKRIQLLELLRTANTRMIMIDEVQNILAATRQKQEVYLQELKFLSNELGIPIVCAGTTVVERAIQTDLQIGSRFDTVRLPLWRSGKLFATFLIRLAASLDMDGKSLFSSKDFIKTFCDECEGLTGEARRYIAHAASLAREQGKSELTIDMFEEIDWTRPSQRRRAVDMID